MFIESILEEVRRDFATFADAGTLVEVTESGDVSWQRDRKRLTAKLVRRAAVFPDVRFNDREFTYEGFLSSEAMADLKDLAQSIVSTVKVPSAYIPLRAQRSSRDETAATPVDALELINAETSERPMAATKVIFLYGNAGIGKTSTLANAAKSQAEAYLAGKTGQLFLYLDAQGKGLNQLEDVMARALQDLRAKFTYHSVASLTRRNCIIPIVDGFDELIGPSNAREAFSNLAQFLAQLDCDGALLASSRSAFIDYVSLHERALELAAARGLSYQVAPIELLALTKTDALKLAETKGGSAIAANVSQLLEDPRIESVVRKPFYLSHICELLQAGGTISAADDLARQIIDAALAREADKLKDSRGKPLLNVDGHREFCEIIADEMWCQESPELDCDSLRMLAEAFADTKRLDPKDAKILVDRSISHGLLVPVAREDRRVFEHELFRFEFQAGVLSRALKSANLTDTRSYLCRAELPLDVVDRLTVSGPWSGVEVVGAAQRVQQMVATRNAFAPTNAAAVIATLVRDRADLPTGLQLSGLYFRAVSLGKAKLEESTATNCIFERVDFRDTLLVKSDVTTSTFIGCTVGERTSLSGTRVEPAMWAGLVVEQDEEFDPAAIRAALLRLGATADFGEPEGDGGSEASRTRIELAERFLRKARTQFYFSKEEKWERDHLVGEPSWVPVEDALRRNHLLEDKTLQKSGRRQVFMRLVVSPDSILRGRSATSEPKIAAFWADLG